MKTLSVRQIRIWLAQRILPSVTTFGQVLQMMTPAQRILLDDHLHTRINEERAVVENRMRLMADDQTTPVFPRDLFARRGPHIGGTRFNPFRDNRVFEANPIFDIFGGTDMYPFEDSSSTSETLGDQLAADIGSANRGDAPSHSADFYLEHLQLKGETPDGKTLTERIILANVSDHLPPFLLLVNLFRELEQLVKSVEADQTNSSQEEMLGTLAKICDKQLTRETKTDELTLNYGKRLAASRPELLSEAAHKVLAG